MQIFNEEGRLKYYEPRSVKVLSEGMDWKRFIQKSKQHAEIAQKLKPDIVQQLNEKAREEKESEIEKENIRKRRYEDDWNKWEPYWEDWNDSDREEETGFEKDSDYEPLSEQALQEMRLEDERWAKAETEYWKQEASEKRRQKYKEKKAAMNVPIKPLPQKELCAYEKIREDIIKERAKAMLESGYFDDILDYKKKIGLLG